MITKVYQASAYQPDNRIIEVRVNERGTAFWKHPTAERPHGTFTDIYASFESYRKAVNHALALGYAVRVDADLQQQLRKNIGA